MCLRLWKLAILPCYEWIAKSCVVHSVLERVVCTDLHMLHSTRCRVARVRRVGLLTSGSGVLRVEATVKRFGLVSLDLFQ